MSQTQTEWRESQDQATEFKSQHKVEAHTELTVEVIEQYEYCVIRVDPAYHHEENMTPVKIGPTMTAIYGVNNLGQKLEASHELLLANVMVTVDRVNYTEAEEDTTLCRENLQKVMGVSFIAAATRKDRNIKRIVNFVRKRDCILIDERIIIPQLRHTIPDSLHLTHRGAARMLDLCEHIWFPHIQRTIVQMAQNWRHGTKKCKNLKPALGKTQPFQMDPVVSSINSFF